MRMIAAACVLAMAVMGEGAFAQEGATQPAVVGEPGGTQPAAAAEGTTSVKPAFAQDGKAVATEIDKKEMVTYLSEGQDIAAYLVTPKLPAGKTGAVPAVIVVPDIFGMTDFVKVQAENLAKQGYVVLVPDVYSRLGERGRNLDAHGAWAAYEGTTDAQVRKDLSSAIDYLQDANGAGMGKLVSDQPIGIVGYDMGGIYAMMMAGMDLRVSAGVNFYGRIMYSNTSEARPVSPVDVLTNVHAPLLSFYGVLDPQVPASHVRSLESRLSHNPNKSHYEIVRLQDVGHGFMQPGREGYNEKAAKEAGERMRDFLARTLRAAPVTAAE